MRKITISFRQLKRTLPVLIVFNFHSLFGQYEGLNKDLLLQIYISKITEFNKIDSLKRILLFELDTLKPKLETKKNLASELNSLEKQKKELQKSNTDIKDESLKFSLKIDYPDYLTEIRTLLSSSKKDNIAIHFFSNSLEGKTINFMPDFEQFSIDKYHTRSYLEGDIHSIHFINNELCEIYSRTICEKESEYCRTNLGTKSSQPTTVFYKNITLDPQNKILRLTGLAGVPSSMDILIKESETGTIYILDGVVGHIKN